MRRIVLASVLAWSLFPRPVLAQCMQPSGTHIPTDTTCSGGMPAGLLPVFSCVCDRAGVCDIGPVCSSSLPGPDCPDTAMYATCESRMWHAPNDNTCIPSRHAGLDPIANCMTGPDTFSPTCALTFTLLSRGTARFHDVFGWYPATGTTPGPDDLHVMLDCNATPGTQVVLDVRADPAYHGGPIGFFLLTPEDHAAHGSCAGGDCCASVDRLRTGVGYAYFSEPTENPDGNGVVHLLTYDSMVWSRKFYFAWEDLFGMADNNFTDLVTSVDGVECAGAGDACDTGMPGACGHGVTRCSGSMLTCASVAMPEAETCNGLDDDCDAMIDEAATCSGTDVCDDGRCVPQCVPSDEFTCVTGFACDAASGLCRETACMGVSCGTGQVCRGGTCTAECQGVTCPYGQICERDQCVDPCAGVTCAAMQVCREGICVPGCDLCDGVVCAGGLTCAAMGSECTDPSCATPCSAGTHCSMGSCVDDCAGAVCPRHQVCVAGQCVVPPMPDGGVLDAGVTIDASGVDASFAFDANELMPPPNTHRSCTCGVARRSPRSMLALGVGLVLAVLSRRRR